MDLKSDNLSTHTGMGMAKLSAREEEILGLLDQGITRKDVASRLQISEHTVKTYCERIVLKSRARSIQQAAFLRRQTAALA